MQKIVSVKCARGNNKDSFCRYSKDRDSYQKYLCRKCNHQFASDRPASKNVLTYPRCPICRKATFLHYDYEHSPNYRCHDKKYNHSMLVYKPAKYYQHLCLNLLEKPTLNVCITLFTLLLLLYLCFALAKIFLGILP